MSRELDRCRELLERHPRASWRTRGSRSVELWLDVHEQLRRDCAGLTASGSDYAAGRCSALQFAVIAAPRLRGLIARMQGHHQIEDFDYFPAFRRVEPALARDFDRLESEHARLLGDVDAAVVALDELRKAAERTAPPTTLSVAARRYAELAERLCERVAQHLTDEEDLVVPLLLDRGDL